MASDPPCCEHYGILGGTTVMVPVDPSRIGDEAKLVGCNRLFCVTCRSWVRHIDDIRFTGMPDAALYFDPQPSFGEKARGHRFYWCRCAFADIARTTRNRLLTNADGWRCGGHPSDKSAGGADSFHTAVGSRATRTVANLDSVEPELAMFVRGSARWLDPTFPRQGTRGPKERGQWTDEDQVPTYMQLVKEYAADGRGLEFIRTVSTKVPGEPHEGAHRVVAVGLGEGVKLELWWSIVISANEVRGKNIELIVAGANSYECIADFRAWFGPATLPTPEPEEDSNIPWQLLT